MRKILFFFISTISCYFIATAQNVGIGETSPASKFSVKGNLSVGIGYSGTAAPANGAIIEGNVGIGNASAPARLYLKGDGTNPIFTAVDNTNVVKVYVSPTGNVGINTNAPGTGLDVRTTDAVKMPSGTTAQRPSSPLAGTTRFNTDCSCLEYYDGTQWVSANTTQVPVGTIAPYAGTTSPSGWLICDGSAVSRSTYALLFSIIGTTYGAGDGSTTFNLPDLRGRTTFGLTGAAPFASLGATGGSLSQTPTINTSGLSVDVAAFNAALPDHTHSVPAHFHGFSGNSLTSTANTTVVAGGHSHTVDPPSTNTSTNGDHSHNLTFQNDDYNGLGGGNRWGLEDDAGGFYDRATSTNGNHSHSLDIAAFTSGPVADHSHTIPALSISTGTIGLSTGVNGNATMTSGNPSAANVSVDPPSTTVTGTAISSAVTLTNPYQVTNYIIKATNTASASIVAANIPTGTFGQTLYFNSGWTATSNMYNNGTNVGIGTTSPSALFDVNGNVRVRSLSTGVVKSDANGNLSSSLVAAADIATTGVSAGTYRSVTVNAQGQVTAGTNPTTLAGYGITDAAPLSGGTNYIQNTTSQQASSNFNISGNGTVGGTLNTANVTSTGNSLNLSGAGWGMNFIIDADNNSTDSYIFNGNGAEIMRLTDAGNLGIGTATPNATLDVRGTTKLANASDQYHSWFPFSDNNAYISGENIILRTTTSYSERMRITSGGNVGIGLTNPGYKLHVAGDIYADGGWLRVSGNQGLYFESHGTGIQSVTADGGQYGSVSTYGGIGGWEGFSINGSYVYMASGNSVGLYNDIDNRWQILIDRGAGDNGFRFFNSQSSNVNMRIQHTNGTNYASYDGDNNWDFYSDRRLKQNIEKEENILDRLLKLDVVNYDFINQDRKQKEIGFIAQEVEPYFPSIVSEATDDRYDFKVKALGYSSFGVLAVGGIKELKNEKDKEITELKTEIEDLKKMVFELQRRVNNK